MAIKIKFHRVSFFLGPVFAEGPTSMFWDGTEYDAYGCHAVFTTREAAEAAIAKTMNCLEDPRYRFEITEISLAEAEIEFEGFAE